LALKIEKINIFGWKLQKRPFLEHFQKSCYDSSIVTTEERMNRFQWNNLASHVCMCIYASMTIAYGGNGLRWEVAHERSLSMIVFYEGIHWDERWRSENQLAELFHLLDKTLVDTNALLITSTNLILLLHQEKTFTINIYCFSHIFTSDTNIFAVKNNFYCKNHIF
jgi:uncharacterized membrane protein